jgi:hypothetical protein
MSFLDYFKSRNRLTKERDEALALLDEHTDLLGKLSEAVDDLMSWQRDSLHVLGGLVIQNDGPVVLEMKHGETMKNTNKALQITNDGTFMTFNVVDDE